MTDLSCWIIIQCMKPDIALSILPLKLVYFLLTKDFCTLNDYPASKISHVIIYTLSLATE